MTSQPPTTGPTWREHRGDDQDRRRLGPLDRRERAEQHRSADRHEHAAADALEDAEGDELFERLFARPQSTDATVNVVSANRNTFLVPNRSPIQPDAGIQTASESR